MEETTRDSSMDLIGMIAEEILERLRRGERPHAEEYAERHPGLAHELRSLFPALFLMERLGGDETSSMSPESGPELAAEPGPGDGIDGGVEQRERYSIVGEIGRGGMGVVFEARQQSLGRRVALKQLPDAKRGEPHRLIRFLREAELNGQLEHPGIVPVYGRGGDDQGRPFYVMRYIEGITLREAIQDYHRPRPEDATAPEHSLAFRQLLRRFVDVCNAVAYAHSRGVLHRDLKPANVMLGAFGETLVVDWGLAKRLGTPEGGGADPNVPVSPNITPTVAGSAFGSPGYMSPEQARGEVEAPGPATDIYGLGAILYTLLAGNPPVTGSDPYEVLEKTRRGEITPPSMTGAHPPRPLEAVCLKALAREPSGRYPTARVLAEDVERWLADEPVTAYREPWVDRARRWMRRHRSLVASGAVILPIVTLVSAIAGILIESARHNEVRALEARNEALAAEVRAKAEADRRLNDANEVVETFLNSVSNDLDQVQGAQPVRRRLLAQAADYFARVARERTSDRELEYEAFRATYRSGKIRRILGDMKASTALYHDAAQRGEELLPIDNNSFRCLRLLADTQTELGVCMMNLGRTDDAESAYRRAIQLFGQALATEPNDPEALNSLASAHNNLGIILKDQGQPDKAELEYRRAIELRRELVRRWPDVTQYYNDLGSSLTNFGLLQGDRGRYRDAVDLQRESVAVRERLVKLGPNNPWFLRGLALSQTNLALALGSIGRDGEAIRVFEVANAELLALVERNPNVPEFRWLKANALLDMTDVLARLGWREKAMETIGAAVLDYEALAGNSGTSPEYRFRLGAARLKQSSVLDSLKRCIEAQLSAQLACDELDTLASRNPAIPIYMRFEGLAHLNQGNVLHHLGRDGEAEPALRQAIELLGSVARSQPDLASSLEDLGQAYESLAGFHRDRGEAEPFLRAVDEAVYRRLAAVRSSPDLPQPHLALAKLLCRRSEALLMLGRVDEAAAEVNGAVRSLERAAAAGFDTPRHLALMAEDPDLASLHSRADFRLLVAELLDRGFPPDPFAPRENTEPAAIH